MLHKIPDQDAKNPFNGTVDSLTKTIAMFVGEIEYGDLPNNKDRISKYLFQLYLIAFIILIIVVFTNFLNGLAIVDINQLMEESEVVSVKQRLDIIYSYEKMFFGKVNHEFWGNHELFQTMTNEVTCLTLQQWILHAIG